MQLELDLGMSEENNNNTNEELIEEAKSVYTIRYVVGAEDLFKAGINNVNELSRENLSKVLWNFGLDTKNFNFETKTGLYVNIFGVRKEGLHYVCSERTDNEWCQAEVNGIKVASDDALIENAAIRHGRAHAIDLRMMQRGIKR